MTHTELKSAAAGASSIGARLVPWRVRGISGLRAPPAEAPRCPRSEELAALVDDRLEALDRGRLLAHLLDCRRCYAAFREVIVLRALPVEPSTGR